MRAYVDGEYQLDGTTCTVNVIKPGSITGVHCSIPGRRNECEFHYVLRRDSDKRAACRSKSGNNRLLDQYARKYALLLAKLVLSLKRNEVIKSNGSTTTSCRDSR